MFRRYPIILDEIVVASYKRHTDFWPFRVEMRWTAEPETMEFTLHQQDEGRVFHPVEGDPLRIEQPSRNDFRQMSVAESYYRPQIREWIESYRTLIEDAGTHIHLVVQAAESLVASQWEALIYLPKLAFEDDPPPRTGTR